MFQFPAFAFRTPTRGMYGPQPYGLPHSDTSGSTVICTSPELFAACRVLLRRQEPGHPPCALLSFLSAAVSGRPRGSRRALFLFHPVNELVPATPDSTRPKVSRPRGRGFGTPVCPIGGVSSPLPSYNSLLSNEHSPLFLGYSSETGVQRYNSFFNRQIFSRIIFLNIT